MKRIAMNLLMLYAVVTGYSAMAQETYERLTPKVGIKGGVNFTNLRVDKVGDDNIKVGYNFGLFAKLPVGEYFAIQPELLYSSKGTKLTYDNFFMGEGEYRFNLNYIELPVLAVFNIGNNFNIHAGPYAAYLVSANIKDLNDDGNIEGIGDLNVDNFNRFDYGLAAGIGVDLMNVSIGARYQYGLREVGKNGSLSGELTDNAKNSGASLYVSFGF